MVFRAQKRKATLKRIAAVSVQQNLGFTERFFGEKEVPSVTSSGDEFPGARDVPLNV